jgi:hypothetical protein
VGVTVGAQEGLSPRGLTDERVDAEHDGEPPTDAPNNDEQQQADAPGQVGRLARRFAIPAWLSDRVHDVTVLSVIMLIQLVWLSLLAYGLFSIFK